MINGVIAQKLQNLDTILIELCSLGLLTVQELEQDWRTKRAVERSLQILVELDMVNRRLVLFGRKPLLDELADLRDCLQNALTYNDIDLVVLNDASPTLRFEAISGRSVYVADLEHRAAFVSLTARE